MSIATKKHVQEARAELKAFWPSAADVKLSLEPSSNTGRGSREKEHLEYKILQTLRSRSRMAYSVYRNAEQIACATSEMLGLPSSQVPAHWLRIREQIADSIFDSLEAEAS